MKKAFSAREIIFSIVIVSLGTFALAASILQFQTSQLASQTTLGVVTLDQAVARELVNLKNYSDEKTKAALRSGRSPEGLVFRLPLNGGAIDVRPTSTVTLDRSFHLCTTYPIGDCGYKIHLAFEPRPPAVAYDVASSFPEAALKIDRAGRNEVVIPRSVYRDSNHVACDLRQEIGLSGLVSSDRYDCIRRPSKLCARGTLPKALIVDSTSHSLELECGNPSKIARCPAFYALSKVNTKSLDAVNAREAECVRTTASPAMPARQPEPNIRLVGRACPAGYRSESSCSLVNIVSKPGECGTGVAKPVQGKLRFTENKPLNGSVDCGVELQNQSCGAVWTASAQLKIKCVLEQPEFVHAL